MHHTKFTTGTYAGTGAVLSVPLTFKPLYIRVWNETDGTFAGEYIDGAGDGSGYKIVDSGVGTTDLTFVSTNGITPGSQGFTVGTDAGFNTNAKTYRFVAFGK